MTVVQRRKTDEPTLRAVPALEDGEAFAQVEQALDRLGSRTEVKRDGLMAQCPAHDDRTPSLSVTDVGGKVLLHCFAGCDTDDVLEALGLSYADLNDGELIPQVAARAAPAVYEYRTPRNGRNFRVIRGAGKTFRTEHWDRASRSWLPGRGEAAPILYRLPEVLRAIRAGETVYVVEGERDADSLTALGLTATTNPHGAGHWHSSFSQVLEGAEVVVVADKDTPGVKHAQDVAASLRQHGCQVTLMQARTGKDTTDHLNAGHSISDLVPLDPAPARVGGGAVDFDPSLILGVKQLFDLPPLMPLVDGLIDRGDLAMAYGMWSSGKSFFALDVALSVASGTPWHGRQVHAGPVLYVAAEAIRGLRPRVDAWLDHHDVDETADLRIYPRRVDLLHKGVGQAVGEYAAQMGVVLVVFDTLGRCISGAEENSSKEMSAVMEQLADMQAACTDLTVMYVHHTDKAAKWARGSSVLGASVDTSVRITRTTDGYTVLNDKRREHEESAPLQFDLLPIGDSVVPVETSWAGAAESDSDTALIEVLAAAGQTGVLQSDLPAATHLSKGTVSTALKRLEAEGRVQRRDDGRSKRCTLTG